MEGGSLWFAHVHITTLALLQPGLLVEELGGNNILMIPQSPLDSSTASNTNGPFQADVTPLYFSNLYGCQQCGYIHIPCNGHLTHKPCLLSTYMYVDPTSGRDVTWRCLRGINITRVEPSTPGSTPTWTCHTPIGWRKSKNLARVKSCPKVMIFLRQMFV